jgi:hypothetical protein
LTDLVEEAVDQVGRDVAGFVTNNTLPPGHSSGSGSTQNQRTFLHTENGES